MIKEGNWYVTKLQTAERFFVNRIEKNQAWGIYEKNPHLLNCPIELNRLIDPEKIDLNKGIHYGYYGC
jgi:hypothetical protein